MCTEGKDDVRRGRRSCAAVFRLIAEPLIAEPHAEGQTKMTRPNRLNPVAELSLVGLLVASLAAACTGKIEGQSTSGSGTGGSGSGNGAGGSGAGSGSGPGTGGSGSQSGSGTGGSVDGGADAGVSAIVGQSNVITCVPGIAATTQIPRMLDAQYDNVISDLLGVTALTSNANQPPSALLSPDSTGSLDTIGWNGYQTAAAAIAAQVFASATTTANFMSCNPATNTTTCLTNTIQTFGRKAFRRPLTTTEVSNFMALNSVTPAGTPTQVAQSILNAFLVSPSFIMLPELNQTQSGSNYQLNSYEIAARLSFLFLNSVPDATLSTAADNSQLTTKAQILAQAQRLLQSPKAASMATSFSTYYLAIENGSHWTNNTTHDATAYPAFTANSYAPAMAEISSFFQNLTLNGGSFSDIFLSSTGYVTSDTAALYGLDATKYTTTPTQVTLDSTQRPGFLTRVGFLSTFSHSDVTSPIFRGAFITGRVLGINPGTPNPNFLSATPPPGNYTTERDAITAMVANQPCLSCHGTYINPPGFVLEHYNAVGTWQDTDPLGGTINGTADVYFNSSDTETISSPLQLMMTLSTLSNAQYTYAQNWVSFASGRTANANDACTVNTLSGSLAQNNYTIANMMADYTQADSFSQRTMGN
jgi:Protein of unknown function (DUF1592)/Protein of unknown function (DUF1588)/Protein of unknown function (DUF1595)/Protein of unknown function (DUF1585)